MHLVCDYLVVGSGAAALAFANSLPAEIPDGEVVLVDADDVVHSHWPSVVDRIASKSVGGLSSQAPSCRVCAAAEVRGRQDEELCVL